MTVQAAKTNIPSVTCITEDADLHGVVCNDQ